MLRHKIKIITSIFGVDGSGKTTLAKELKKKIKKIPNFFNLIKNTMTTIN